LNFHAAANLLTFPPNKPTKSDLTIDLKTTRALGLTLSESFLQQPDEVIE
jgi:hypothetical protein